MSLVIPNLYIGDIYTAKDFNWLKRRRIMSIVNCASEIRPFFPEHFNYLNLRLDDNIYENLFKILEQSFNFIDESRNKGFPVLVHCHAGISRSSSIVCYYLMKKFGMTVEEALNFLRESHPSARPNTGFYMQLSRVSF